MSANPHAEHAAALLAANPGEYEIEKSKALATLAVAYEQRTANMIALYNMSGANCLSLANQADMNPEQWNSIAAQIAERLGLA